jgi:uncharacterized protein (DUF1778 family)
MPKVKATRIATRGVGRQTTKKTGYITTSLRLLAEENRELRAAAAVEGLSFNGWAVNTLLKQAKNIQKRSEN